MPRYLAMAWDSRNAAQRDIATFVQRRIQESHPRWQQPFLAQGLAVFQASEPASSRLMPSQNELPLNCGVLLGSFFRYSPASNLARTAPDTIDVREVDLLKRTGARSILQLGWGSYVLFMVNESEHTTCVFRGPMSNLACLWCEYRGVRIFFTEPDDCIGLGLMRFTINWDNVRTQAASGDFLGRETAINEIHSLEPGECLHITDSAARLQVEWTPRAIALNPVTDDFHEAARLLRSATLSSVEAWTRTHGNILHTLSGGIDSSIVLSALTHAPSGPTVTCTTHYSRHPVGDERVFARTMANHAQTRLVERERDFNFDMARCLTCARTPYPTPSFTDADSYPFNVRLAAEIGATAIFNGEPGDNVFGSACNHEFVTEFIWRRGIRKRLIDVALDYAQLRGQLVWSVLVASARDRMRLRRTRSWSTFHVLRANPPAQAREYGLLTDEAAGMYETQPDRFLHPWLRDISGMPPGKYLLLYALPSICSFRPPFAMPGDPPTIAPLASQPLIECVLRIPSYLNIVDGVDRSLARYAFRDDLPDTILTREGKGGPDIWTREIVAMNRGFLTDVLGQGALVRERIVDRAKLASFLSEGVSTAGASAADVVILLYLEAWARQWTSPNAVLAAA